MLFAGCSADDPNAGSQKASATYYNENGVKLNTDYFYPNGKLRSRVNFDGDGNPVNRFIYTYDEDANLLEIMDSVRLAKQVYEYDSKGRRILQYTEDFTGKSVTTSTYLDDGLLRIDSNKVNDHLTIARLDEHGNELEMWKVNELGDTTDYSVTTYNEDNLEVENKYYIDSYIKRHRKLVYDDDKRVIEELWYGQDGRMRMRYVNEYDEFGRLVLNARYTDNEEDFRLEYEYKGNMRYCTTYIPRVKTKVTKEEYTFFD